MRALGFLVAVLVYVDSLGAAEVSSVNAGSERLAPLPREASRTNEPPLVFSWGARWEGWDGLHLSLMRKTWLGLEAPGVTNVPVLNLETTRMTAKIGAKVALDAAAYSTDDRLKGFDPGVEVRRARLYAKGDCLLLIPVSYELEVGYVPGSFYIENSYLQFRNLSFLGELKLGQFQPPISLVNCGSSRDMMFMEPAAAVQALAPGVNAGFQVGRPVFGERMTWAFGLFTDSAGNDFGDATRNFGRAIGRLTGLALYDYDPESPNTQQLLHLGLSGSLLYAGDNSVRYRSRPESHLAPYLLDTGDIRSDGALTIGTEVAWVNGPLSLQGEYLSSWVQEPGWTEVNFSGFYLAANWFLTGESRPYDRAQGIFGRVIPQRNFDFGSGGWGAWEIAARYSQVDLSSGAVQGGRLEMVMGEVNWYLHSHVKWRFNYGFGRVSDRKPDGNFHVFQTRLEVDL